MLRPETIAEINRLVNEESDPSARLAGVAAIDAAEALQWLAYAYNWDDGYAIPQAIADHPKCDLGVALDLFWLAEALSWFKGEIEPNEYNRDWVEFCTEITRRILAGRYVKGVTSFKIPLGIVKRHDCKKSGVPPILISDVHGELPAPFSS